VELRIESVSFEELHLVLDRCALVEKD